MNHAYIGGFSAAVIRPFSSYILSSAPIRCLFPMHQVIGDLTHHVRLPDPRCLRGDSSRLMADDDIIILVEDSVLIHGFPYSAVLTASASDLEPVADTPDGFNILRLRGVKFNLLADFLDVYGDSGNITDGIHIPDFTEQLFL